MIKRLLHFLKDLAPFVIKITIGAMVIGLLKNNHVILALLLAVLIPCRFMWRYSWPILNSSKMKLVYFGMGLSTIIGTITELFGTTHGYWTYFGQHERIPVPFWVPLAWGCAYKIILGIEETIFSRLDRRPFWLELSLLLIVSMLTPVYGEIITISLFEVWSYHWHPQWLGIPMQAASLLCLTHIVIFFSIRYLYIRLGIPCVVYNPRLAWISTARNYPNLG